MTDAALRAKCEAVAFEITHRDTGYKCCLTDTSGIEILIRFARSIQAEAWREIATKMRSEAGDLTSEQCEGCGNYDDVANAASNDELRSQAAYCEAKAKALEGT